MGTGIVSILLHNLPYNSYWLRVISYVIFALNVYLFTLFMLISILRYTLYPAIWNAMIRHPAQSLFLGTVPMGLSTIVNMVCFVCVPAWGGGTWKLVSRLRDEEGQKADDTQGLGLVVDQRLSGGSCVLLPPLRHVGTDFRAVFQSTTDMELSESTCTAQRVSRQ